MKNLKVEFIENYLEEDFELIFVVIVAKHNGKWVFVRHKDRNTWEVPGGHIEHGENTMMASNREICEETGAVEYTINQVCIYNVQSDGKDSHGMLFYADIDKLSNKLEYEIEEISFHDEMPSNLTYPDIQPFLV